MKFQAKITKKYTRKYANGSINIPQPIFRILDRNGYTHVTCEIDENTHAVTLSPFKKEARDVQH